MVVYNNVVMAFLPQHQQLPLLWNTSIVSHSNTDSGINNEQ